MAERFKEGDVVCLKSEPSFKMTVGGDTGSQLTCYYIKDGKVEFDHIYSVVLMLAEKESPKPALDMYGNEIPIST